MTTTLIFGVLLIVAGIAFAILAYALLTNRRGESPAGTDGAQPEAEAVSAPEPEPVAAPAVPPPATAAVETVVPPPSPPVPPVSATPAPRTFDVARLMRDEVSGALLIAVGPRTYRTVDELRASSDWPRLEAAARDLQAWFTVAPRPKPPAERRPEEASPRSGSILDQLNAILVRKLAQAPELPQGVRLAPSPEGGVRVMIGLQAYPLDEVPDAKVNQLIRESVSEWENQV
ncbi:MAG: hypothetical protein MUO23_10050 [Anaerolineales bacterium]|nr:hypothetical protein [Anaerolineales bacterium]